MLYGSEASCLKGNDMGILRRTERSIVRVMFSVQLKDKKRSKDLMLSLNDTIAKLTMAVFVGMVIC